jgi:hypothetical protein
MGCDKRTFGEMEGLRIGSGRLLRIELLFLCKFPTMFGLVSPLILLRFLAHSLSRSRAHSYGGGSENLMLPFGTRHVLPLSRPWEDRNRTAPMPFCGNRFEFRAVGAAQNICFPMALLNTVVAEAMQVRIVMRDIERKDGRIEKWREERRDEGAARWEQVVLMVLMGAWRIE